MEPATDRQLNYLLDFAKEGGISVPRQVTKGQASDCIGLFEEPKDEEVEMLTFFELPEPALNSQTHYRWALAPLLADPQRVEEWEARPANARLKDEIRYLGGKVPKGTLQRDAESIRDKLAEENPQQAKKLEDLSRGYEEAVDLETCRDWRSSKAASLPGPVRVDPRRIGAAAQKDGLQKADITGSGFIPANCGRFRKRMGADTDRASPA